MMSHYYDASYNSVFTSPPYPTFLSNNGGATDAATALAAALSSLGVTALTGQTPLAFDNYGIIPYLNSGGANYSTAVYEQFSDTWNAGIRIIGDDYTDSSTDYAVFAATTRCPQLG
jgi:hypothetical protein